MLELKNISKSYYKNKQNIPVLKDLSLTLKSGVLTSIQGESGCGKTTLLLTAGGLLHPDNGAVVQENQDVYTLTPQQRSHWRSQNTGFIFQQFHLIPYLTVKENILAPTLARNESSAEQKARELMAYLQIDHREDHLPSELSVGEKQRTALARAVLFSPDVLLADEITGNLDGKNKELVLNFLDEYVKKNKSVLMVTHDTHVAQRALERYQLKNGILQKDPTE